MNVKAKKALSEPNFKDSEFASFANKLIERGILEKPVSEFVRELNKESFGGDSPWRRIKVADLTKSVLDSIIWTKDRLDLLKDHVRLGVELGPVYKILAYIPKKMVDAKASDLRGKSRKTIFPELSEPGVGRLATDEEIKKGHIVPLKTYTLKKPYVVSIPDPEKFRVLFVNAPHLGLEYNRVLAENFLRNALVRAEKKKFDAVVLTGALMWLDASRAHGHLTTHRALYSGLDFDPDALDPGYGEKAKKVRKEKNPNVVTFSTLRERVKMAMGGYRKVFLLDERNPVFSGKVYVCFGKQEEEMIEAAAHDHIRYVVDRMRGSVDTEKKALEAELRFKLSDGSSGGKGIDELRERIDELRREEQRMIQTNVDVIDRRRFVDIIRTLLISWYKEVIPNCEFVAQGSTVFSIGGKTIQILQEGDDSLSRAKIDNAMKGSSGRALGGRLSDFVLAAGPYSVDAREGIIERVSGKNRETTRVWTLPVAIDVDYLRNARPELVRRASPLERLLGDAGFSPGVFELGFVNGIWDCSVISPRTFGHKAPKVVGSTPYIYLIADGDYHYGAPAKDWIFDPVTRSYLPIEVAASELFMREFVAKGKDLPFSGWHCGGDFLHGKHFPTHQARNPGTLPYATIAKRLSEARKDSGKVQEVLNLIDSQLQKRGEVWMNSQLEEAIRISILPRIPFFAAVLKHAKDAGVRMRGTAEVYTGSSDLASIDMGCLNVLGGNHAEKTTFGEFLESPVIAWMIRLALVPSGFSLEELERLVRAPLFGPENIGYGLLSVPDGYEWAIHIRHDPPVKGPQNGWTLRGVAEKYRERGDYPRIFTGRHMIAMSSDIHRAGASFGPDIHVVSVPACTDGDAYGERFGMSRNNIGFTVVGLPVHGPLAGPVRVIQFTHDILRKYFANPWSIDWDTLFRGAI
ncbi:MAG: hypothetical protein AAB495_02480 [Patescibacteria group bacterium]